MKRLAFLSLCSVLIGPPAALANQSCNVSLACTFYDVQSEVIGTVSGNPSTKLTIKFLVSDSPTLIETSVSCTPGDPAATVYFTTGANPEHLEFIKTSNGLIGDTDSLDNSAFSGEIVCAK
jgi:hypothetical protein